MKYRHREQCRSNPKDEILFGESSWGDGFLSVKYGWKDSRGRISRGGEVPIEAIPQMLEVAVREGGLKLSA